MREMVKELKEFGSDIKLNIVWLEYIRNRGDMNGSGCCFACGYA